MNTIAHIAAFVAVLRLSIYLFVTLNNEGLGAMSLILILWVLVCTFFAAIDDWEAFQGKRNTGEE